MRGAAPIRHERRPRRGHRLLAAALAGLTAMAVALPAAANPPQRFDAVFGLIYAETDNNFVVFLNTTRDRICTPERAAWEQAIADWRDGGMVGDPPEQPTVPGPIDSISVRLVETNAGAVVAAADGSDLTIELWHLDAPGDRLGVGPCTSSDDPDPDEGDGLFAAGTADYRMRDSDFFLTGPGAQAFTDGFRADVTSPYGIEYSYTTIFHITDACHVLDGEFACLVDKSTLRRK